MREYNYIYTSIVNDEDDFIGKIAYSIYKEDKIAFIKKFHLEYGYNPNQEELKSFHELSRTDTSIERYRLKAETLLQEFLNNTLQEAITETAEEIKSNHILLIRDEVLKIKPPGFWKSVYVNVISSIVITAILALLVLIINFSTEGFWATIGNLFDLEVRPK